MRHFSAVFNLYNVFTYVLFVLAHTFRVVHMNTSRVYRRIIIDD